MGRIYRLAVIFFFILSGCVSAPDTIRDVRELRQDHAAYLTDISGKADPLPAALQARMDEDYNVIYFSVWHQTRPFHAWEERVRHDFRRYALRPGYGENKKPHPSSWLKKLQRNADLEGYPNAPARGITTRNTNLRDLPTNSPHFTSANGDSSAWPFDNLQRSSVPAGTPVFVCHVSEDKAWALVETSFTYGWMPAEDFARVNEDFAKTWESGRYAVILRDSTSVLDRNGRFLVKASVGHLFPFSAAQNGKIQISVAVADQNRQAVIRQGFVPAEAAAAKPLRFTQRGKNRQRNDRRTLRLGRPLRQARLLGHDP